MAPAPPQTLSSSEAATRFCPTHVACLVANQHQVDVPSAVRSEERAFAVQDKGTEQCIRSVGRILSSTAQKDSKSRNWRGVVPLSLTQHRRDCSLFIVSHIPYSILANTLLFVALHMVQLCCVERYYTVALETSFRAYQIGECPSFSSHAMTLHRKQGPSV